MCERAIYNNFTPARIDEAARQLKIGADRAHGAYRLALRGLTVSAASLNSIFGQSRRPTPVEIFQAGKFEKLKRQTCNGTKRETTPGYAPASGVGAVVFRGGPEELPPGPGGCGPALPSPAPSLSPLHLHTQAVPLAPTTF